MSSFIKPGEYAIGAGTLFLTPITQDTETMSNATKRICVYDSNRQANPPENLIAYSAWLTAVSDSIPAEFLPTAMIETTGSDYSTEITIYYYRPETPEEIQAKLDEEKARNERREQSERAIYETLKKKFEQDSVAPDPEPNAASGESNGLG